MRLASLLVLVGVLGLAGCPQPVDVSDVGVKPIGGNVAIPGTSYNFLTAFTAALPCAGSALVWSIREQSFGWLPIDGNITQAGVWTSPGCGSAFLGQLIHVDAKCTATGQTASATIATVPETVSGVQIAYTVLMPTNCLMPSTPDGKNFVAQGSTCPNAPQACTNAGGCYCILPSGTLSFYAKVTTTCGEVITPALPTPWPPATCP